jgi:hypothetical protein
MIDTKAPISVLNLNTRAMNAIRRHTEIKTVEELILYDRELLYLPEIAKITFAHIQEKLAEHNLYLQSDKKYVKEKNYNQDYINRLEGALDSLMALYKLQTKHNMLRELTEEEIKEVADSVCHDWNKENIGSLYMTDFAKAILQKAREK